MNQEGKGFRQWAPPIHMSSEITGLKTDGSFRLTMMKRQRRARMLLLTLAFIGATCLGSGTASFAQSARDGIARLWRGKTKAPPPASDFARRVVELVNHERTAHGCRPLKMNSALNEAALAHSREMARANQIVHTGPDGSEPGDRMSRAGYHWSTAAENVAAGYSSPESVVRGWMLSPGHRRNILNCKLRDTGVGYDYLPNDPGPVMYYYYWTEIFGVPR